MPTDDALPSDLRHVGQRRRKCKPMKPSAVIALSTWNKVINATIGILLSVTVCTVQVGCSRSSTEGTGAGALIGGGIGFVVGGPRGAALGAASAGMIGAIVGSTVDRQKRNQVALLDNKISNLESLRQYNNTLLADLQNKYMQLAQYEMQVESLKWHVNSRSTEAYKARKLLEDLQFQISEEYRQTNIIRTNFEKDLLSRRYKAFNDREINEINRTHKLLLDREYFLSVAYSII